jgi:hypothetical protein
MNELLNLASQFESEKANMLVKNAERGLISFYECEVKLSAIIGKNGQMYLGEGFLMNNEVRKLSNFLNTKMVLRVNYSKYDYKTDLGVDYSDIFFTVTCLHMEFGEVEHYFSVKSLHPWNAKVLIEDVMEVYGE